MIFLKVFNQLPGLGIKEMKLGNIKKIINGKDSPKPIIIKIVKTSILLPANAKPTAVPTRGAEQGVANKVINMPFMKSSINPLPLYERIDKNFDGR